MRTIPRKAYFHWNRSQTDQYMTGGEATKNGPSWGNLEATIGTISGVTLTIRFWSVPFVNVGGESWIWTYISTFPISSRIAGSRDTSNIAAKSDVVQTCQTASVSVVVFWALNGHFALSCCGSISGGLIGLCINQGICPVRRADYVFIFLNRRPKLKSGEHGEDGCQR